MINDSNNSMNNNNNLDKIENNIDIKIKIRTLDNEFLVEISAEHKVEELKRRIENISKVPTDRQRLIFRGKLLKDNDLLSLYKIAEMDVIHLVAKTGEQVEASSNNEENAMNNDSNNANRGVRREATLFSIMNRLIRLDNEESGTSNSNSTRPTIIPAIMGRRLRRGSVSDNNSRDSDFNSIECREAILQNFASMNNLMECSSSANKNLLSNIQSNIQTNTNSQSPSQELFNFKNKKLYKGQWVDVKDTIEQWLEAQVIDVKDNQVYIHYNGWGTRWDEWIDMDSDRIRPFRFHTRQTAHSNYQSPFPHVKPDANVSLESNLPGYESFFDIFDDVDKSYEYASNIMHQIKEYKKINNIESQREVYRLSKNLAPFLDKFGRTITDIGGYINTSMRNNKLEDLDKKLYETRNLDSSLKPYDQNELHRVEIEEAAKRSRRESGANIITPVNILDREITSQVPLIDSSLHIQNTRQTNSTPMVDIYVQTFYSPLNGRVNSNNGNNNSTLNSNNLNNTNNPSNNNNNNTTNNRQQRINRNPFDILFGHNPFSNYNLTNEDTSGNISNEPSGNQSSSNLHQNNNSNLNNSGTSNLNADIRVSNTENEFLGNKRKKDDNESNQQQDHEENIHHGRRGNNNRNDNTIIDDRNSDNGVGEAEEVIIEEYFENDANLDQDNNLNNFDENNRD